MTTILVIALIVTVIVAAVAWAKYALYRSQHPYSASDVDEARKDALRRSRATVSGKVGERFAPVFPSFFERFNPRDAKFLGNPVDFVIFDGLEDVSCARWSSSR